MGPSFFWRTIEDDLGTIAQYYDAPVLSLRNAVYHLLREGRPGFHVGWCWSGWAALPSPCLHGSCPMHFRSPLPSQLLHSGPLPTALSGMTSCLRCRSGM